MNTYLLLSHTNYGETVTIINATSEAEARNIAKECNTVWDGYDIEKLDTKTVGVIGCYGGGS